MATNKDRIQYLMLFIIVLLLSGCDSGDKNKKWNSTGKELSTTEVSDKVTITIGDIDPDTPTNRMKKILPLAQLLARELGWHESRVKIRIVKSIEDATLMIKNNQIDLLMDSSFPILLVQKNSDTKIILELPVMGKRTYKTLFITSKSSAIKSLENLKGKTIALQERYSTSGYLLPAFHIISNGYNLTDVTTLSGGDTMPTDSIGYIFSGDEENTLLLIRKDLVAAGVLSSHDYQQLSEQTKNDIVVIAETQEIPRKFAAIRSGVDEALQEKIIHILLSINDSDRINMGKANSWKWRFVPLDEQSRTGIKAIENMMLVLNPLLENRVE